ncbi:MAG TPA: DUF1926 domain-containing protein [Elusimicrobiota bacterium]|nr:DUF1926 domain-containing protein [Elusimicrobiota bacterium]
MGNQITFLLGVHNHQPVGNFGSVFQMAFDKSYRPFLDVARRFPNLKFSYHTTGPLWDWLLENQPAYCDELKGLVREGRAEVLTGGYYEPILTVLPDDDQQGQIRKMNRFLKETIGTTPQGLWLAERVWEPHLPKALARAGIRYTLLDSAHFLSAGCREADLTGYFMTENEGHPLAVFPISQKLRYMIPFRDPEEVVAEFGRWADDTGERALVMFDDGEKFGLWPGTNDLCYKRRWLERFFEALSANSSWIKTETLSEYMARVPARGRVYLPTGSYHEMGEWTLPVHAAETFHRLSELIKRQPGGEDLLTYLRGGMWRNFLTKYPESNNLHKKMLQVSEKVHRSLVKPHSLKTGEGVPADPATREMMDALWGGQCNCPYWHGVFGGLYLPHLRHAVYERLLRAERLADRRLHDSDAFWADLQVKDFDMDGHPEILAQSGAGNIYCAPSQGGGIFEWDRKDLEINFLDILSRHPEAYHSQIREASQKKQEKSDQVRTIHDRMPAKQEGLEQILFYDWHRRALFLDHFLHSSVGLDAFKKAQYGEQGDFVLGSYDYKYGKTRKDAWIQLSREGHVWAKPVHSSNDLWARIHVEKTLYLQEDGNISADYRITNKEDQGLEMWFSVELALSFADKGEETVLEDRWECPDRARPVVVRCQCDPVSQWWSFPLETVSQSEEGFEKTFQGLVLLPHWRMTLNPKQTFELSIRLSADKK